MSVAGFDVEAAHSGVASEGLVVQRVAAVSDGVDGGEADKASSTQRREEPHSRGVPVTAEPAAEGVFGVECSRILAAGKNNLLGFQ